MLTFDLWGERLEMSQKRPYAAPTFSAAVKLAEVTAQIVSGGGGDPGGGDPGGGGEYYP